MEKIVRVSDVIRELDVSRATASRMIAKVVKHYDLDKSRLAVKGSCPENLFLEYYQLNIDAKRKGENKN